MFHVDATRCSACGTCVEACPVGAISLDQEHAVIDQTMCNECGACLEVCTEDAISEVTVPEVVQELPQLARRPRPPVSRGAAAVASIVSLAPVAIEALSRIADSWLSHRSTGGRNAGLGGGRGRPSPRESSAGSGMGRGRRRRGRGRR